MVRMELTYVYPRRRVIVRSDLPYNIEVVDSYNIWNTYKMKYIITAALQGNDPSIMGRTMRDMIIEWYLHNIGYVVLLPFKLFNLFNMTRLRLKHVDLETWIK